MSPRVLQFIGSFHQGGSERQAIQLTKLLHNNGEFEVFAATLDATGVLSDEINSLGIPPIPEFKLTSFYDLNFFKQLKLCVSFLLKQKIDIVHTHDFYTNVFGIIAARLAGIDVAISSKRETGGMRTPNQDKIEKWIFGRSSGMVVNSNSVKNYLIERGVAEQKLNLIYNGLDVSKFGQVSSDRTAILKDLSLPTNPDTKFITLVANLRHEVKNHPMLLRAAKTVLAEHKNAHFILAGEGDLTTRLKELAVQLEISENIHFVGRCSNIPALLSISDIGVLTSFAEGFSNSIIEYMAAGLPVIATDVGGASEVVKNGDNGFLIDSDDDTALAKHIIELIGDQTLSKEMGRKGLGLVEHQFSLNAQLSNTKDLYRRSLSK